MVKLYKPSEAAKFLGVSKRTIKYMKKDGRIVPDKVDDTKHIFYSESQLLKIKNGANFVSPSTQNFEGDTSKTVQNCENGAKTVQNCVTTPFIDVNNEGENQKILAKNANIPPETVQNCVTECINDVTTPSDLSKKCYIDEDSDSDVSVVKIVPANKLVLPNDKFAKDLFNYSQDEYIVVLENGGEVVEIKKFPKVGEIVSPYEIKLLDGYSDTLPLNVFDKAVLTACISEWCKGNKVTTPSIIYRHITGNDNGYNIKPSPEMELAILDSVNKMMCTQVTYEMDSACKHLKYNDGQYFKITAPILPCQYSSGIAVCGQETKNVIEFYRESPILTIALAKNKQVLTFEKKLLNVPNQHNTVDNISVKHYVIQRVLEIVKHNLTPSITFDDIFKKCNLTDTDRMKKSRIRTEIIELLTCLKNGGDIDSFTLKKDGNKYHSIEFSFTNSSSDVTKTNGGYKKDKKK